MARVYGELIRAQLQLSATDLVSATGLIYFNTTTGPKWHNGTAWMTAADLSSAQTFTNKIISGADNAITNVSLTTGVTGVLPASKGGTGVSNADAATLTRTGDHGLTLTTTAPTSVTLPTTGTLSTLAGAEVFTNKDYDGGTASNTSRTTLPKASKTILDGLTRKQATLVYGEDTNKVYADDGSTLKEIGSGSSGINYLSAQFAADALGTVELSVGDTLATTTRTSPTRWGSSAATALIAQSTNSTLRGTTNYLVSFTANAQFVESPLFTIDGSDLAKPLTVTFDVSGVATADDVQVYVARYNSSNVLQERIVIAGTASATSPNSARVPTATTSFRGFFIPSATATDKYAIRWRRNANNTSLRLDSLFVGPQSLSSGVAMTDSASFTPLFTNSAGLTFTGAGQHQRVGNSLVLNLSVAVTGAGSTASPLRLTLPLSGITAVAGDYAGGNGGIKNADINNRALCVRGISGQNYIEFSQASSPSSSLNGTAFNDTASSNAFYFLDISASIPISQWQTNVAMADRAVEEFASNSSATNADDTTSFEYGISGSTGILQTTALTDLRKKRVRFTTPILQTDRISIEIFDGFGWRPMESFVTTDGSKFSIGTIRAGYNSNLTTDSQGVGYRVVNSTDVDVYFGRYVSFETAFSTSWSAAFTGLGAKWRLRKVSGAAVGFPIDESNLIVRYQEKYFNGSMLNVSSVLASTVDSNFKFSNLVIGRRYKIYLKVNGDRNGTGLNSRNILVLIRNGATTIARGAVYAYADEWVGNIVLDHNFVATATTIEFLVSTNNGAAFSGDGSALFTMARLSDITYMQTVATWA
jgi:hypothetical protein